MYYASRQICSCHWQYSCSSCSLAVSDGRNEPSFLLSSITAEITKLTLPPQEGHIRLESDTGLSKESSVTFKWSLSPSAENVDYRTDTFSSDKNVFITGGRGEEFPWIRAEDNARLVVLRVCWGKKKKRKKKSLCYKLLGLLWICCNHDATRLNCFEVFKERRGRVTQKCNHLGFWRSVWLRSRLSIAMHSLQCQQALLKAALKPCNVFFFHSSCHTPRPQLIAKIGKSNKRSTQPHTCRLDGWAGSRVWHILTEMSGMKLLLNWSRYWQADRGLLQITEELSAPRYVSFWQVQVDTPASALKQIDT